VFAFASVHSHVIVKWDTGLVVVLVLIMVQGMKIPFESSFLGRPCIWFRCIFYFNFLVDIENSFKLLKTPIIAGEHLNAAGHRL
jgi:hypothetical protein